MPPPPHRGWGRPRAPTSQGGGPLTAQRHQHRHRQPPSRSDKERGGSKNKKHHATAVEGEWVPPLLCASPSLRFLPMSSFPVVHDTFLFHGLQGCKTMEEVSGRTKHKAMVRPARSRRPVCMVFCSVVPRPFSLRAGGWRSPLAPPPRTGCLLLTPLPAAAAGWWDKGHCHFPKEASLGEEE